MTRTITTFAAMLTLLALTSQATANLVANGSFELVDIANGGAAPGSVTGWLTNSFTLDNNTTQDQFFDEAVPDGQQVLALSGFATHSLGNSDVPVLAGDTYRISFFAGRRNDASGALPGVFEIQLQDLNDTNAVVFSQRFQTITDADPTTIDLNLTAGLFRDTPVVFDATLTADGGGSGQLALAFVRLSGGEVALDSVGVVAIPEPATGLLMSMGLIGFVMRRRTRSRVEG